MIERLQLHHPVKESVQRRLQYLPNSRCILILLPLLFLIVSSSVYPAIISGIENKELAIMADALAKIDNGNKRVVDTSGYHSSISPSLSFPNLPSPALSQSPPPVTSAQSTNSIPTASTTGDEDQFTAQAALSLTRAGQTNNIVNSKAYYDISFRTSTAGTIKTVEIDFPPGTYVGAATLIEVVGLGPGTIAASGSTGTGMKITYTVTNAVNVPAFTNIRIQLANINNPQVPGASYTVTITTKDGTGTIIDGPTATTAYNMKQIGTADIADSAVTTAKIDDDAVTDAKLSLDSAYIVWVDSGGPPSEISYKRNTVSFDSAFNLSDTAGESQASAVATSGNNVYVVWRDATPGNLEILYRRSTDGGANFGDTVNLSNSAGGSQLPAVAASGNNVYVVWNDITSGNNEILYRRSVNGGASFGATVNLSNNAGNSLLSAIATVGNMVYVLWVDDTPGNFEILYRRSTDGGANFEPTVNLSNSAVVSSAPAVATSGNNVYALWQDQVPNGDIFYRRSTDGGANFAPAVNLSNNAGASFVVAVSASGNNVYVLWTDDTPGNNEILYRRSIDGGANFEPAVNLSNNAGSSRDPSVAVSSANNVFVVWGDDTGGNLEIFYRRSMDSGTTFASSVNLSNDLDNSQTPAVAAFSNLPL